MAGTPLSSSLSVLLPEIKVIFLGLGYIMSLNRCSRQASRLIPLSGASARPSSVLTGRYRLDCFGTIFQRRNVSSSSHDTQQSVWTCRVLFLVYATDANVNACPLQLLSAHLEDSDSAVYNILEKVRCLSASCSAIGFLWGL